MSEYRLDPIDAKMLLQALGFNLDQLAGLELRFIRKEVCHTHWPQTWGPAWDEIFRANREGFNNYFGVCPRQGQKGDKDHVRVARALWVDLDGKTFDASDPLNGKVQALEQLRRSLPPELHSSILVDSGNGYHAYWLFKEPWEFNGSASRQGFESILKGLATTLNGDKAVAELAHVMRLPGTYNVKNPEKPLPCRILESDPSKRFNISDFEDYMTIRPTNRNSKPRSTGIPGRRYSPTKTTMDFLASGAPEGERNTRAFMAAADLSGSGFSKEEAIKMILKAANQCGLPEGEAQEAFENAYKQPRTASKPIAGTQQPGGCNSDEAILNGFNLTDSGQAEAIAHLYGGALRFDHTNKRWLIWDGNRWKEDEVGEVYQIAKRVARKRLAASVKCEDDEKRPKIAKWSIASESSYRISCTLELAANQPPIATTSEQYDQNPWLLGCTNGVLNLRTCNLGLGQPEDMMTFSTKISYKEGAQCPRWRQFLVEIFRGDAEVISFIQRAVGYSLTGDIREQVMFLLYGTGSNGKSVFLNILSKVLGQYAQNTPISTILADPRGFKTNSNDLAALRGKRFVTATEVKEYLRFDEGRIKVITGGDPITARFLHKEFFTYQPQLKLWVAANHKPIISDTTESIWRRICLVPFKNHFSKKPADSSMQADNILSNKLMSEAPGIFCWCVEGCRKWQQEGLGFPESVRLATQDYRDENDPIGKFIEERLVNNEAGEVPASVLYREFGTWCQNNGEILLNPTVFGNRMKDRELKKEKSRGVIIYKGIAIKDRACF